MMIATDAIGMGLNLQIRRIIFSTVEKYDGNNNRPLTISVRDSVFCLLILAC